MLFVVILDFLFFLLSLFFPGFFPLGFAGFDDPPTNAITAAHKSGCQKQALNTQILHYTIKIVAMENKARYNVLDDKIVIIVTLPDKVRDRPLRCLRFCGR